MSSTTTLQERRSLPRSEQLEKLAWPDKVTVDISQLLKPHRDDEEPASATTAGTRSPVSVTSRSVPTPVSIGVAAPKLGHPPLSQTTHPNQHLHVHPRLSPAPTIPAKRSAKPFDYPTGESPAKKQSKWSPEEDARIIQLRGDGMKWEDISKHLPGRSAISCRLHYQNYLERRSEWDEDRKNKLARLYERFKADMWARIAEEMAIPWRAAEAMHWQMGEHEMARRAGVTPFVLAPNASNSVTIGRSSHHHHHHHHHQRSNSFTPNTRRSTQGIGMAPQLPSLAELTAGLPAYVKHAPQPNGGVIVAGGGGGGTRQYTIHAQRSLTPPHLYHDLSNSYFTRP